MNNKWRERDKTIDLHLLMEYFDLKKVQGQEDHSIYKGGRETYVVIATSAGHRYYSPRRPGIKLGAFDLILEKMSKKEGGSEESIWEKVEDFYTTGPLDRYQRSENESEPLCDNMFNHFRGYTSQYGMQAPDGPWAEAPFQGKAERMEDGRMAFPLHNLTNTHTGYLVEGEQGMELLGDSDESGSIWFSNIPKKIKKLMVFSSPKEAMAFHQRFAPEDFVYISLGRMNYEKARILTQIHQRSRSGKIGVSFTGKSKMAGYIDDLLLLSFLNDTNFLMRVENASLTIQFNPEEDTSLHKISQDIKKYNVGLNNKYLEYNKILDQQVVDKKKIVIGRKGDHILSKIPLDISAIKYFLWSYYRNYMSKTVNILKPKGLNWEKEYLEHGAYKGTEMETEHRIAV